MNCSPEEVAAQTMIFAALRFCMLLSMTHLLKALEWYVRWLPWWEQIGIGQYVTNTSVVGLRTAKAERPVSTAAICR